MDVAEVNKTTVISDEDDCFQHPIKEVTNLISEVRKGEKTLQDICICCCKVDCTPLAQHPLLYGNLCKDCKQGVYKICVEYAQSRTDGCLVCATSGHLVHCSNCYKSYCKTCIELLVSKGEFAKILKDGKWFCYSCKESSVEGCLIRRRLFQRESTFCYPEPPVHHAFPISVVAFNEMGYEALRSCNIKINNYLVNPPETDGEKCTEYNKNYNDFSTEIKEIASDLVLGSFFTANESDDKKSCNINFFISFYRFLYRLNISRLFKEYVFFLFVADEHAFDDYTLHTVFRYLEVDPCVIFFGVQKIFVWTNIKIRIDLCLEILDLGQHVYVSTQTMEQAHLPIEERVYRYFFHSLETFYEKENE